MSEIYARCNDQELILLETPTIASGGVKENVLNVTFDSTWDGYEKNAIFYQNEKEPYFAKLDSNNECVIPWEATKKEGSFFIGIFGVKDDAVLTSEVVRYKLKKGAVTEDIKPSIPENYLPDDYLPEGVGCDLPKVTEADNGKHLEVVDGAWTAKEPEATGENSYRTELLSEQALSFALNDSYGMHMWSTPTNSLLFELVEGETYTVVWDEAKYTCVAEQMTLGSLSGVGIGNNGLVGIGDDTGEPFIFAYVPYYGQNSCITQDTNTTHTVAIYQETSANLPEVTEEDNGKILKVIDGKWKVTQPENIDGLPEVTTDDNGKHLEVVEGAWQVVEQTGGGDSGGDSTGSSEWQKVTVTTIEKNGDFSPMLWIKTDGKVVVVNMAAVTTASSSYTTASYCSIIIDSTEPLFNTLYTLLKDSGMAFMYKPTVISANGYRWQFEFSVTSSKLTFKFTCKQACTGPGQLAVSFVV